MSFLLDFVTFSLIMECVEEPHIFMKVHTRPQLNKSSWVERFFITFLLLIH